ncbi:Sperm-associated antigen 5 [Dermatophagoides pteronyssinus]|uniref:Sperm-associated antigen 5 n=1 Tax=Dermatophagoides pteronyssinus TaxID=6956 RepID=A0ABQ8J2T0_DERPT|nr:Sperm-associated antigen 5 [Dermatophagoides pteronyssinus]
MDRQEDNEQQQQQQITNVYGLYLQKYYRDLQRLQLQHGRLWQSYRELQIKSKQQQTAGHHQQHSNDNTKTDDEQLRQELEQEKLLNKTLNAEREQLISNIKTFEIRHKELLAILNKDYEKAARIKELENENKELRETLDFVTSENTVLRDIEERSFNEKREWIEEKKKYEEVVVWSKHLNDKHKQTLSEIESYTQQIDSVDKFLNIVIDSYVNCTENTTDSDLSSLIDDFRKCSINNTESFAKKLEITEKFIKLLPSTIKPSTAQQQNSDILNNNSNSNTTNNNQDLKMKIADLIKENSMLKENIQCLKIEIDELKKLLSNNNDGSMSGEQIDLKLENVKILEKLRMKEDQLEKLNEKFARNRAVLEENYRRSLNEIKTLDNFIAIIIDKLNKLPDELKKHDQLKELITIVNEN